MLSEEAEKLKLQKLKEIQENLAKQAVIDQQRWVFLFFWPNNFIGWHFVNNLVRV